MHFCITFKDNGRYQGCPEKIFIEGEDMSQKSFKKNYPLINKHHTFFGLNADADWIQIFRLNF